MRVHPGPAPAAGDAELEMTPMIDVTFLLLIFFLCTLRFRTLEGRLEAHLPRDTGSTDGCLPAEPLELRVDVARAGLRLAPDGSPHPGDPHLRHAWNQDPRRGETRLLTYRLQGRVLGDLTQVEDRLRHLLESLSALGIRTQPDLVLDPGPGTCQGDVVPLLDACAAAGFRRIAFEKAR